MLTAAALGGAAAGTGVYSVTKDCKESLKYICMAGVFVMLAAAGVSLHYGSPALLA